MTAIAQLYPRRTFTKTRVSVFSTFLSLIIGWGVVLLVMRVGEWLFHGISHQFPPRPFLFLGFAVLSDLLFLCKAGIGLLLMFLATSPISLKAAKTIFIIVVTLLSIGYFALMQYFNSTTVLLGADLYGYSAKDIQQTVGASGGVNFLTIMMLVIVASFLIATLLLLSRKLRLQHKFATALTIVILVLGILRLRQLNFQPSLGSEYNNNLVKNKLDFFLTATWSHFFPEQHDVDIYADTYLDSSTPLFRYVDEKHYPFLRSDSTADVLTPFFKKQATPPNIVIILVEGLGRAFTNEGAYLGNFTPFVDSLSRQSLYWKNFLSGGGRTFAVLPTLLGSLPFGQTGFNEMTNKPKHLSLASILNKNGYSTSFYYAGDASFDNMSEFMRLQGADAVMDKGTFPSGYQLLPANNGFTWGYGDKELFRYFLNSQRNSNTLQPSLNVLLTVATHSPFSVPDINHYSQAFERRMDELHFTSSQKEEHRAYSQQYETILYADDALKDFFEEYSKRADFNNTIFIITGDHRMPEIPMASKIDRFHVPLIIYSPLLKRHETFESVSTHFDITPSLLAFLKTGFAINEPSQSAWLGSGLDTTHVFQNLHAVALKQTKTDLVDFIMGDYHLNGDDLFKMNEKMGEDKIEDPVMKGKLQAAFARFQQKNNDFLNGAPLIPDSLYRNYHQ